VITPFLEQQYQLTDILKPYGVRQVLTIDKCQGIDCDIVLLSCAKWTAEQNNLLKDLKRLNVALTRAKKMLVVIGTEEYLKEIEPIDRIIGKLNSENWVQELNHFDTHMCSYLPEEAKKVMMTH